MPRCSSDFLLFQENKICEQRHTKYNKSFSKTLWKVFHTQRNYYLSHSDSLWWSHLRSVEVHRVFYWENIMLQEYHCRKKCFSNLFELNKNIILICRITHSLTFEVNYVCSLIFKNFIIPGIITQARVDKSSHIFSVRWLCFQCNVTINCTIYCTQIFFKRMKSVFFLRLNERAGLRLKPE